MRFTCIELKVLVYMYCYYCTNCTHSCKYSTAVTDWQGWKVLTKGIYKIVYGKECTISYRSPVRHPNQTHNASNRCLNQLRVRCTSVLNNSNARVFCVIEFIFYRFFLIVFIRFQVLDLLLDAGALVTETDNDGRVPLILSAQEGHMQCVETLLRCGSDIESRGHDGRTALRWEFSSPTLQLSSI